MTYNAGDIEGTLTVDRDPFIEGLRLAKEEAARFERDKIVIPVDADGRPATRKLEDVETTAKRVAAMRPTIVADADTQRARTELQRLAAVGNSRATVTATADTAAVRSQLAALNTTGLSGKQLKITADIATAEAAIQKVRTQIDTLGQKKNSPKIDADIAAAEAHIAQLTAQMEALGARKVDPKVDIDIAAAQVKHAELAALLDALPDKAARDKAKIDLDIEAAKVKQAEMLTLLEQLPDKAARDRAKIDLDIEAAKAKGNQLAVQLDQLAKQPRTAKVDGDMAALLVKIAQAGAAIESLQAAADANPVKLDADSAGLLVKLADSQRHIEDLQAASEANPVKLDADTSALVVAVADAQHRVETLQALRADPKIDADIAALQAKIDQGKAKIAELSDKRNDPHIDADISAALAKIEVLQARIALLREQEIQLQVDTGDVDAAESSLEGLVGMADAAAAAFPPVSAAIVAIPGALQLVADPLFAVALGVDGIKRGAYGLAAPFAELKAEVSGTFENGMKPAIQDIDGLLPHLQTGLTGTARSVLDVATGVTKVAASKQGVSDLDTTFNNINGTITGLTPSVSSLVANFLHLGEQGSFGLRDLDVMLAMVGQRWDEVVARFSQTGAARDAVGTLVQALGELLGIIPPLVAAGVDLWNVVGPPLVAALHGVGVALEFLTGPLGGVTTTVLSMVIAFRAATIATTLLAAAGGKVAAGWAAVTGGARAAAAANAAAAASSTSAASAATGAAAAGSRFGTVMAGVGRALPVVAAAAIGLGYAYSVLGDQAADGAKRVLEGSMSSTDAINKQFQALTGQQQLWNQMLGGIPEAIGATKSATELWSQATEDVSNQIRQQLPLMGELPRAQAEVTLAQDALNTAQAKYPPGAQQVIGAQRALAQANINLAVAQSRAKVASVDLDAANAAAASHFGEVAAAADDAAGSAATWQAALLALIDPTASAADKTAAFAASFQGAADQQRNLTQVTLATDQALTKMDQSLGKIPAGVVEASGAINTSSEAGQKLAQTVLSAAKAYDNLYGATLAQAQAQGKSMPEAYAAATAASENYRQKLITEAQQHGLTRAQAQALVDTYFAVPKEVATQIQQPGMVQALADALGLKDKIVAIPNDKSIIVSSITEDTKRKLEDLGLTVRTLPNGQILITPKTEGFFAGVQDLVTRVQSTVARQPIDGDPAKFNDKLNGNKTNAAGATATQPIAGNPAQYLATVVSNAAHTAVSLATQPITGNPAQFNTTVETNKSHTAGSLATQPITGNPAQYLATVVANAAKTASSLATQPITGNPAQFNTAVSGAQAHAAGSPATVPIKGNNGPALAAVAAVGLAAARQAATVVVTAAIRTVTGKAAGGIVAPMADGGIVANATGNVFDRGLTPMRGGLAEVVPPNTWRVIGDNLRVPESYIPQDGSARSRAILAQTAAAMGFSLLPKRIGDALAAARAGRASTSGTAAPDPAATASPAEQSSGQVAGKSLGDAIRAMVQTALGLARSFATGAASGQASADAARGLSGTVSANTSQIAAALAATDQLRAAVQRSVESATAQVQAATQNATASAGLSTSIQTASRDIAAAASSAARSAAAAAQSAAAAAQSASAAAASRAAATATPAASSRSTPPPDDDSFESNSYYDPNRGKPGYVQTEDGSWVKKGYYNAAGNVLSMAGAANVVPPNVLRFIGDNLTDPEAFIPINGSSRSQAILAHTASAMGFALVPQRVADALAAAGTEGGGVGGPQLDLRAQIAAIRSTAQQGGDTGPLVDALREEIRNLGAQLRAIRGGVTFNNVYNTKSSETQADATTRVQKRQAAFGLFGDQSGGVS